MLRLLSKSIISVWGVVLLVLLPILSISDSFDWSGQGKHIELFQVRAVEVLIEFNDEVDFEIGDKELFKSLIEIPLRDAGLKILQGNDNEISRLLDNPVQVVLCLDILTHRTIDGRETGLITYDISLEVYDNVEFTRFRNFLSTKETKNSSPSYEHLTFDYARIWKQASFGFCKKNDAKSVFKEQISEYVQILRNHFEIANSEETMKWYREYETKFDSLNDQLMNR